MLAWQNDSDGPPFWSRSLLHVSCSINTSLSCSTKETPLDVVFCCSDVSSPLSLTKAEDNEEEEIDGHATNLHFGASIAQDGKSIDQSDI